MGVVLLGFALSFMGATDQLVKAPGDVIEGIPADFPRFYFAGKDAAAQALNRYLWNHFSKRGGEGLTLFNKEYCTVSDMWLGGGMHPGWHRPIQEIHRENLLGIRMNPDGYVNTHQHYSHAHEQGWPFPLWTQNPTGPEGYTAGWHFQHNGPGWVWDALRKYPESTFCRDKAVEGWGLENVKSHGLVDERWKLEATGPSPCITTPANARIVAYNAPFVQLRWTRTGTPKNHQLPYVEWMREGDTAFSEERRMYFQADSGNRDYEAQTKTTHSMAAMWQHPLWNGNIKQIRIALAPGESDVSFTIDSFFTVYDTRHTINNPIYILACWEYFRWTGDVGFLQAVLPAMRKALDFQRNEMGGLRHNHIRNPWSGHDGRSGLKIGADGVKQVLYGRGIGANYWDLLPFGWDDLYATNQYYASTLALAEAEEAVLRHPEWSVASGAGAFDPVALREHAEDVKKTANRLFWNKKTKRFNACIDSDGQAHDYGFTFLNLDAIWYGLASDRHADAIMDWLDGRRIVDGDTSTGDDIYHWRFGPRATTKRNIDWYAWCWTSPESIPWGGQVQDGGAVLGFSFYDLWARLQRNGADDAWRRFAAIMDWENEVWAEGGYRKYYEGGKRGTTLQGGGTAGGLGIDCEFYESSLVPAIAVAGFLGIRPSADTLVIRPKLPTACPEMGVRNVAYRGAMLDVLVTRDGVEVEVQSVPAGTVLSVVAPEGGRAAVPVRISAPGVYRIR